MSKSVQTVERKAIRESTSQKSDTAHQRVVDVSGVVKTEVGRVLGPEVGEIAGAATSAAIGAAAKQSSKFSASAIE